jgi:GT2 family glycosyltransferase
MMEDIELGYRLFLHGAKNHYSTKPFAQHKEWSTGGTRKSQKNLPYVRLISKLYLYKKHFPGWSTKQFIIHELLSALLFRDYVSAKFRPKFLLNPLFPLVRILKIIKANYDVNCLLANR